MLRDFAGTRRHQGIGVEGLVVRRLELGIQDAGVYRATNRAAYWNGRNEQGEPAASGAYFVELSAGDVRETRRIVLLK